MYTKDSTDFDSETVTRFRSNPVGFTVALRDGTQREVFEFRDTPKGRWYRLGRRRFGPWVPAVEVVGVVTFTVSIRPGYLPHERKGA